MQNPKSLNELLARGGNRLSALRARSSARASVLDQVRAALPHRVAQEVVSAGIDRGRLTVGVSSAAWASRIRYLADSLKKSVAAPSPEVIHSVRVRVVPPTAACSI